MLNKKMGRNRKCRSCCLRHRQAPLSSEYAFARSRPCCIDRCGWSLYSLDSMDFGGFQTWGNFMRESGPRGVGAERSALAFCVSDFSGWVGISIPPVQNKRLIVYEVKSLLIILSLLLHVACKYNNIFTEDNNLGRFFTTFPAFLSIFVKRVDVSVTIECLCGNTFAVRCIVSRQCGCAIVVK